MIGSNGVIAMYNSTKGVFSYSMLDPKTSNVLRSGPSLKNSHIDGGAIQNNEKGCYYYMAEIHTIHVISCDELKIEKTFYPYAYMNFFRIQDLQFDNKESLLYGIEIHDWLPKSHDRWRIVKYEISWPHIFVHEVFAFPKEMNYGKIEPTCFDSENHIYVACGYDDGEWKMFVVDVKSNKLVKTIVFGDIQIWDSIECTSNDKGQTMVIFMPAPYYDTITYLNVITGERESKYKTQYPILKSTISTDGKHYIGRTGGWEQRWYFFETKNWTMISETTYSGVFQYMRYL